MKGYRLENNMGYKGIIYRDRIRKIYVQDNSQHLSPLINEKADYSFIAGSDSGNTSPLRKKEIVNNRIIYDY